MFCVDSTKYLLCQFSFKNTDKCVYRSTSFIQYCAVLQTSICNKVYDFNSFSFDNLISFWQDLCIFSKDVAEHHISNWNPIWIKLILEHTIVDIKIFRVPRLLLCNWTKNNKCTHLANPLVFQIVTKNQDFLD